MEANETFVARSASDCLASMADFVIFLGLAGNTVILREGCLRGRFEEALTKLLADNTVRSIAAKEHLKALCLAHADNPRETLGAGEIFIQKDFDYCRWLSDLAIRNSVGFPPEQAAD